MSTINRSVLIGYLSMVGLAFFSCSRNKAVNVGVYHFYDELEPNGLVTKTLRLKRDHKFYLFGIKKNPNAAYFQNKEGYDYLIYITYGDWFESNSYLILNENKEYLNRSKEIFVEGDTAFLNLRSPIYIEIVPKISNDSFRIWKNDGFLDEMRTGIRLTFVKR